MNERDVRLRIQSCVYDYGNQLVWKGVQDDVESPVARVESYNQRRVQTAAEGFVLTLTDGSEYQVSVVKSKLAVSEK